MEIIKCSKCGCEVPATSEVCPICGTSTNKVAADNAKAEESIKIPKRSLAAKDTCQSLEKALVLAAANRKSNPLAIVCPCPIDESCPINSFFENTGILVGVNAITNRPSVYSEGIDNIEVSSIEDCKHLASDLKCKLAQQGIDDVDVGYDFTTLDVAWFDDGELYIELYLSGDIMRLSSMVEELNQIDREAGGNLILDIQTKSLIGTVKLLPVKGGFFEKKRIKKVNKTIEETTKALIDATISYLED